MASDAAKLADWMLKLAEECERSGTEFSKGAMRRATTYAAAGSGHDRRAGGMSQSSHSPHC